MDPEMVRDILELAELEELLRHQETQDMADRAHLDLLVDGLHLTDEAEPYAKDWVAIKACWDAIPVVYCDNPDAWPALGEYD